MTLRLIADWLRLRAVLGDDPTQDLGDLDALHAALARPAISHDASIAITVGRIRDRAHLELALRDRLPIAVRERWLGESCRPMEMVGEGLIGDRILNADWYTAWLDFGLIRLVGRGSNWHWRNPVGPLRPVWQWAAGWDDLPIIASYMHQVGTCLRTGSAHGFPDHQRVGATLHAIGFISDLRPSAIVAAEAECGHRQTRLAVRLLAMLRSGRLPPDQADLLTRLGNAAALTGGADRFNLLYERPAPDRFRLVIDPGSPAPFFDEPGRMAVRAKAVGSPPSTSPLTMEPFLEIRVPPTP